MDKKTAVAWFLQIGLALVFIVAAFGKLTGNPEIVEAFRNWVYSDLFLIIIGAVELIGGICLLIPRTAGHAALGLMLLMIGAVATLLINREGIYLVLPGLSIVLLAVIVLIRRPWPLKSAP